MYNFVGDFILCSSFNLFARFIKAFLKTVLSLNFHFQAAYERMKEARRTAVEFLKEIARGVVDLTPEQSHQFSFIEKVKEQK